MWLIVAFHSALPSPEDQWNSAASHCTLTVITIITEFKEFHRTYGCLCIISL